MREGRRSHRIMIAAFGDPGHAFPAIALGRALTRRGHDVLLETWTAWRSDVEREGMRFAAAPQYQVFPDSKHFLTPYQAAVWGADRTREVMQEFDPALVVVDILTVAAAFAAEIAGRPWATLIPHVLPMAHPGFPVYSTGARLPRTRIGARFWRSFDPLIERGTEQGREELNDARRCVGLGPLAHSHGGISRDLAIVATFPQLEYPRPQAELWARVTGPLLWERPAEDVALPPGDDPLVLIAPSTAQDPERRMLDAALRGLAGEPVRVLATTNRPGTAAAVRAPANARVVDWLSYARVMPACDAVVSHAGHGTVVRALASGTPLVACPAAGDMGENAARVNWAGAGVALPRRLVSPRGIRLAVRTLLADSSYAARARQLSDWARDNDGANAAAQAAEELADSRVGARLG
ncbi:MAG: hypothetical protein NVSMB25_20850 [Thermoleophilaceae bacterium]